MLFDEAIKPYVGSKELYTSCAVSYGPKYSGNAHLELATHTRQGLAAQGLCSQSLDPAFDRDTWRRT